MKEFNFIQAVDVILRYNQNNFVEDDYYIKWSNSPVYKLNKSQIYNIACPDIYGSEIENGIVEKIWFDEIKRCNNKKNLNTDRNRNYKTNAVILASPHKTEYENHCFINYRSCCSVSFLLLRKQKTERKFCSVSGGVLQFC